VIVILLAFPLLDLLEALTGRPFDVLGHRTYGRKVGWWRNLTLCMHPTADTLPLNLLQSLVAAGDVGRQALASGAKSLFLRYCLPPRFLYVFYDSLG
jgi:hypothetical protein